jgi:CheY-like chemotaxis protein
MVTVPRIAGGRHMSLTRVLVVEDYEPFRRFVRTVLGRRPDFQIIAEVSDGVAAIEKTRELGPDLVLLDIGLPGLNGIEAARRIRTLVPQCKIIFMTQESSLEVVEEAFRLGARGYVIKSLAGSDLLPAVDAVRAGGHFVSSAVPCPAGIPGRESLPSLESGEGGVTPSHVVEFYSDDPSLVAGFTRFVEDALKAGDAVIVLATGAHRKGLLQELQTRGIDGAAAMEKGRLTIVDAAETLATFMVNDLPDPVRFFKAAGDLVAEAVKTAKGKPSRVLACGELAPALWAQGNGDAAIQLEGLWDEAVRIYGVDTLCGYVLTSSQREQDSDTYERICAAHSAVS